MDKINFSYHVLAGELFHNPTWKIAFHTPAIILGHPAKFLTQFN
jgi:hypothetical protein